MRWFSLSCYVLLFGAVQLSFTSFSSVLFHIFGFFLPSLTGSDLWRFGPAARLRLQLTHLVTLIVSPMTFSCCSLAVLSSTYLLFTVSAFFMVTPFIMSTSITSPRLICRRVAPRAAVGPLLDTNQAEEEENSEEEAKMEYDREKEKTDSK